MNLCVLKQALPLWTAAPLVASVAVLTRDGRQLAGLASATAKKRDDGTQQANFGEVRELSTMPGCLIELAFHDNEDDAEALADPRFRRVAARAIAHGQERGAGG